jgi:hypothetical protein
MTKEDTRLWPYYPGYTSSLLNKRHTTSVENRSLAQRLRGRVTLQTDAAILDKIGLLSLHGYHPYRSNCAAPVMIGR